VRRWIALFAVAAVAASPVRADSRAEAMRSEIKRLRSELEQISRKESGLLGEIARLDADVRLREAEAEEAGERIVEIDRTIAGRGSRLRSLERAQQQRRRYLGFRMREL
jgi:septal ring factor EnvC (AmiA/AmiB activator)